MKRRPLLLPLWGLGLSLGLPAINTPIIDEPIVSKPVQPNSVHTSTSEALLTKITFALSTLSPEGLYGSGGGARSLSYEFCIPATSQAVTEVQTIDSTVRHFQGSRGRIGCRSDQFLCIGNTFQPDWREVLMQLAALDYVERIDPFWGE